jgi:hypothetical protein
MRALIVWLALSAFNLGDGGPFYHMAISAMHSIIR